MHGLLIYDIHVSILYNSRTSKHLNLIIIRLFCTETNFKDNPALSMLNDSDEEVHYG